MRCCCKAKNTGRQCKSYVNYFHKATNRYYCLVHARQIFNNYCILIQKIYRGYKARKLVVKLNKMPRDIQILIIDKIRSDYYYKKYATTINAIIIKYFDNYLYDLINYVNNLINMNNIIDINGFLAFNPACEQFLNYSDKYFKTKKKINNFEITNKELSEIMNNAIKIYDLINKYIKILETNFISFVIILIDTSYKSIKTILTSQFSPIYRENDESVFNLYIDIYNNFHNKNGIYIKLTKNYLQELNRKDKTRFIKFLTEMQYSRTLMSYI